jgi:hypothetical protein
VGALDFALTRAAKQGWSSVNSLYPNVESHQINSAVVPNNPILELKRKLRPKARAKV